jgi:bacilysin biosynthesis protein BacA
VDGKCNALIVANAYQDINIFYMEESLKLLATFIEATPEYGIAIRPNFDISSLMHAKTVCIASHQVPVNILDTISLERDSIFFGKSFDIKLCTSTSIAAKMVAENEIDYCLTNSKSVEKYELKFASNTKRIDMVWSLFGRPDVMPMFLLAV